MRAAGIQTKAILLVLLTTLAQCANVSSPAERKECQTLQLQQVCKCPATTSLQQAQQAHSTCTAGTLGVSTQIQAACGKGATAAASEQEDIHDGLWETFIVRFSSSKMVTEHRSILHQALGHLQQHWTWLDRKNKAQAYPSDFALLSVARPGVELLQQALQQVSGYKDMHPDRRIRGLKDWQPEGPLVAAFSDGFELQQQPLPEQNASGMRLQQQVAADMPEPAGSAGGMSGRQLIGDEEQASSSKPAAPIAPSTSQPQQQGQQQQATSDNEYMESIWHTSKPPGRFTTKPTIGLDPSSPADREASQGREELRKRRSLLSWSKDLLGAMTAGQRGRALANPSDMRVTTLLEAKKLWDQGFSGKGIKVGVFDTGIREGHPHIRNIKERTNWTHQNSLSDGLGHGSFVAGVIGSQDSTCPGFAPDVELYTFKVFTDDQVSYTSWFLDAFNYAIASKLTVINLSIGGPDFLDLPFIEKVWEVTSNGLIMISAIGNDGPLYGTLNNPADQPDVIGVGGIDNDDNIASFSSRGMTTWELPAGTGRIKPDVMAYAKDVTGSKIQSGCRSLSGTSVASPVVAGAVCLLASTVPEDRRWMLNPASMKQALVEGSVRLPTLNMHEQGNGRINLPASQAILANYTPRASLIPPAIHLADCPYMWPHCKQELYAFGLPLMLNATVVNGMANTGKFDGVPVYEGTNEGGKLLHVTFKYSEVLWPWSGYLGIFIEVSPAAWNYSGNATGTITFTIKSPPQPGSSSPQTSKVVVPVSAVIRPTPPRNKRIIWDVLHSVKYPPGYVPRDNLDIKSDVLDWHGDHPYTNYHEAFDALRSAGFFVEVLHSPATCFDPSNYGAYLLLDSEEEWYKEEVDALAVAVKDQGMALVVFAEWYHEESLKQMKFFDDNTRSWWTPVTGGANVPALNDLLAPYNIVLGEKILHGKADVGGKHSLEVAYGANIASFPAGGHLHVAHLTDVAGKGSGVPGDYAVFGIAPSGKGQVAVFSDTNCLDSSHNIGPCFSFLVTLMQHLLQQKEASLIPADTQLKEPYKAAGFLAAPKRRSDVNFTQYSWVLSHPLSCAMSAPCQHRQPSDCPVGPEWKHKHLQPGSEPQQAAVRLPAAVTPTQQVPDTQDAGAQRQQQQEQEPKVQPKQQSVEKQPEKLQEQKTPQAKQEPLAEETSDKEQQQQQQHKDGEKQDTRTATEQPAAKQQPAGQPAHQNPNQQVDKQEAGGQQHQQHDERQDEQMQQGQRRAFISQAMSIATFICVAGVVGIVVLWRMRSNVAPRAKWVRKWGGYAPVRNRTVEV